MIKIIFRPNHSLRDVKYCLTFLMLNEYKLTGVSKGCIFWIGKQCDLKNMCLVRGQWDCSRLNCNCQHNIQQLKK
jgi:hypothetical protein